jgi:hypothetical protein
LSELADYRKITGTAMFLKTTAKKQKLGYMGRNQRTIQVANLKERHRIDPSVSRNWKPGFEWKPFSPLGERDTKERYLDDDATCVRGGPWRHTRACANNSTDSKDFSGRNP